MRLLKEMQKKENFSSTEQNIINYMFENPDKIPSMSIRQLAQNTYTSAAGIFRLCQKLGLTGYVELKIKFISEFNRTPLENKKCMKIDDRDDIISVIKKMAALEIEAIEESKNELEAAQLLRIVEYIEGAQAIDFYAFDDNVNIARIASSWFTYAGKHSFVSPAANQQILRALSSNDGSVAILISRTGQNKRLIKIAEILNERRVPSVVFTTDPNSSMVKLCNEFVYVANIEEFLDMGSIIFSTGVQYLLNVIFALLLARNYRTIRRNNDKFDKINGRLIDKVRMW